MILEVDMGNTRIKWRLRSDDVVIDSGAFVQDNVSTFFEYCGKQNYNPSHILVASVTPSFNESFASLCVSAWQVLPRYACVQRHFGRLQNVYDDVSQMGIDRWLAVIAASHISSAPLLVISAGSALTLDLLDGEACHLGGFIVPGLQLMRRSLYRDTDQVKLIEIDYDVALGPGCSTKAAVSAGLLRMQLGLVEQSLDILSGGAKLPPDIIITGGDGQILTRLLRKSKKPTSFGRLLFKSDLIFEGLTRFFDG